MSFGEQLSYNRHSKQIQDIVRDEAIKGTTTLCEVEGAIRLPNRDTRPKTFEPGLGKAHHRRTAIDRQISRLGRKMVREHLRGCGPSPTAELEDCLCRLEGGMGDQIAGSRSLIEGLPILFGS